MSVTRRLWPRTVFGRTAFVVGLMALCFAGFTLARLGWSLFHWQAHIWVGSYLSSSNPDPDIPDEDKHLIFVMVDHYEHGKGEEAAKRNLVWCDKFRAISDRHRDDYGNRFRYTWFYPYDHRNEAIMEELTRMAYDGYGEIEMHWHLLASSGVNNENYAEKLGEAIAWYQQFGAMVTVDSPPRTAFAYIAGVWIWMRAVPALDHTA